MNAPPNLVTLESWVFALTGLKLATLLVAWVRALPVVVIVPAFGLPDMPGTLRGALAMVLAMAALPSAAVVSFEPNVVELGQALLEGITLAVPAAVGIWVATMAGGLFDELSGAPESADGGIFEGKSVQTGTLFGLLAIAAFLAQGGPARLALALSVPKPASAGAWESVSAQIVSGLGLAITIGSPLVIAALMIALGSLFVSKVTPGAAARALIFPVQGLLRLIVLVLFLEWVMRAIASTR
jgi:type III secretory pathway component EscT